MLSQKGEKLNILKLKLKVNFRKIRKFIFDQTKKTDTDISKIPTDLSSAELKKQLKESKSY